MSYVPHGLEGTVLAMVLFGLFGGLLLNLAHRVKLSTYQDMLDYLLGKPWGKRMDFLLSFFLFLGISTMLSASGAVFQEHLYLPKNLGIFMAYAAVMVLLITGKKGLIASYNILVPVKIMLLLILSGYVVFFTDTALKPVHSMYMLPAGSQYWHVASILYVAYNFALAMVVLCEYQTIGSRSDGIKGAVAGGLLLGAMVVLIYLALCRFLPEVTHYEVPMLYVAGCVSNRAKHMYTLVLWMGILTTAIANAYGFAQRFTRLTGLRYSLCLVVCMTMALPLALQSFSGLVARIYPLFGVLGLLILIAILYRTIVIRWHDARHSSRIWISRLSKSIPFRG